MSSPNKGAITFTGLRLYGLERLYNFVKVKLSHA
jgi:hypothetical protein